MPRKSCKPILEVVTERTTVDEKEKVVVVLTDNARITSKEVTKKEYNQEKQEPKTNEQPKQPEQSEQREM